MFTPRARGASLTFSWRGTAMNLGPPGLVDADDYYRALETQANEMARSIKRVGAAHATKMVSEMRAELDELATVFAADVPLTYEEQASWMFLIWTLKKLGALDQNDIYSGIFQD
jgi:hypothetical protein